MDREALLQEAAEEHSLQEAGKRRFIYRDVEELIQAGFLSHTVTVGGTRITLRTLPPSEFQKASLRSSTETEFLAWSLAAGTWIINGLEVPRDPSWVYHLYREFWSQKPAEVIKAFSSVLIGLRARSDRAVQLSEAFCYEPYGRALWKLLGKRTGDLRDEHPVVRMWVSFNIGEDIREANSREWSRAVAIVSSMNNKGAKQISQSLERTESRENLRRQRVIEEAVNWVIRGTEEEVETTVTINGQEIAVPRISGSQTVEDLEHEMGKIMRGEEDLHDLLLRQQQERARAAMDARRAAARERAEQARAKIDQAEAEGKPKLVGYTPEQMSQMRPEVRKTSTFAHSGTEHRIYDRYIAPKIVPGFLTPDLKVVGQQEGESQPEASPTESLQDKISRRKPKFGD